MSINKYFFFYTYEYEQKNLFVFAYNNKWRVDNIKYLKHQNKEFRNQFTSIFDSIMLILQGFSSFYIEDGNGKKKIGVYPMGCTEL